MQGCNSRCEAQMSLSISKLVNVSRKRLPISAVSLTSLLLLISLCFPGQIPDSLDSGLTEKCGQLRASDDVVAAIIFLSIHEEAANSVTHLALHVPVRFLPDPEGSQRVLLRPGERRNPRLPDLGPRAADSVHEQLGISTFTPLLSCRRRIACSSM